MGGIVGRLFREFSVTLAFAIVVSTVVSLSVTPMICAYFVRSAPSHDATWLDRLVEGALARTIRFYDRTLSFVLEHNALALIVFVATIALTVGLYIKTPKGYFPQDDTGLIFGGTQASTDISFEAMEQLQQKAMDIVLADPAVAGLRLLGRRLRLQRLGQSRPHVHQPEAACRAPQCEHASRGGAAARQTQPDSRHSRVHGAGAGPAGRRPAERFAIPVHAVERRYRRAAKLGAQGHGSGEAGRRRDRRHHRPRARRPAGQCQHRPRGGGAARRAHPGHRQRAQRRVLAAADFDHLPAAQPVSRDPGSGPQISARSQRPHPRLCRGQRQYAGAAIGGGACRARNRAAGGEPSGPVPVGHHHLQHRCPMSRSRTSPRESSRR